MPLPCAMRSKNSRSRLTAGAGRSTVSPPNRPGPVDQRLKRAARPVCKRCIAFARDAASRCGSGSRFHRGISFVWLDNEHKRRNRNGTLQPGARERSSSEGDKASVLPGEIDLDTLMPHRDARVSEPNGPI